MNLLAEEIGVIKKPKYSRIAVHKKHSAELASVWKEPASLLLDEAGMIQSCCKSVEHLFGYKQSELVWQHISCLFPQLAEVALVQNGKVNERLHYLSRCGHIFAGLNKQGKTVSHQLNLICLEQNGLCTLRMLVLHI
jgi:hypothetical protein